MPAATKRGALANPCNIPTQLRSPLLLQKALGRITKTAADMTVQTNKHKGWPTCHMSSSLFQGVRSTLNHHPYHSRINPNHSHIHRVPQVSVPQPPCQLSHWRLLNIQPLCLSMAPHQYLTCPTLTCTQTQCGRTFACEEQVRRLEYKRAPPINSMTHGGYGTAGIGTLTRPFDWCPFHCQESGTYGQWLPQLLFQLLQNQLRFSSPLHYPQRPCQVKGSP